MTYLKRLGMTLLYVAWFCVLGVLGMGGMFYNPWLLLGALVWFAGGLSYVVWDTFDR